MTAPLPTSFKVNTSNFAMEIEKKTVTSNPHSILTRCGVPSADGCENLRWHVSESGSTMVMVHDWIDAMMCT